jgi:hypothetical protein
LRFLEEENPALVGQAIRLPGGRAKLAAIPQPAVTGFLRIPIPSISTSTTSPGESLRVEPGVPV